MLNAPLVAVLALTHHLGTDLRASLPALYVAVMVVAGFLTYATAFLFLPIPALRTEAGRWQEKIRGGLSRIRRL